MSAAPDVISSPVAKLVSLLMALALVMTNSVAIAAAKCRHLDNEAHISARQSADGGIAAEAIAEETAAIAASNKGALADAASVQLAGAVMPSVPTLPSPSTSAGPSEPEPPATKLSGITIMPLLEPPAL